MTARPIRAFGGLGAFLATELRVQLHEETAILTSLIVQVVLLIFVGILDRAILGIALMGAILFSLFGLGQRIWNEAAYVRIDHKLNDLYLASPLTPEAYFLGMAGGILLAYLAPIVVLVVVAWGLVHFSLTTALVLLLVGSAVWLFAASFGYAVSTFFKDNRAIWPYASLFYNLFGVLPPVFYPLALFPIRPLALVLPPSGAAALVQWSMDPSTLSLREVLTTASILAGVALGTFAFAVAWARRTVRER